MSAIYTTDIVILGGGIAGLWLLNRLEQEGYQAVLLETEQLGSGQTLKSQGIIHGGVKYTLQGAHTQASQAIAAMPQRWLDCINQQGEINLSQVPILSDYQYLWSPGDLGSRLTSFFASKTLHGRVEKIKSKDYPPAFNQAQFQGVIYRILEPVLDIPSVVEALAIPQQDKIFKIEQSQIQLEHTTTGKVSALHLDSVSIQAKLYVFAAGIGNEYLLKALQLEQPTTQRRPLHQVLVKHNLPLKLYAHCIGTGKPRLTITTHSAQDGATIWYLGGELAESGAKRSSQQQCEFARAELKQLFPWLDFSQAQFAAFMVDRAEPQQANLFRPDTAYVDHIQNVAVAWPTKLALAPALADNVIARLKQDTEIPAAKHSRPVETNALPLKFPGIAQPVWEELL